ncbi:PTS sugar transporter subunit IIA [Lacticaseibacillus thailandensis]|uniref:PTS sugar transporter subunit IIA n=1 Tax=Lacticaseibacillus thailandensis TaxID=381741 RepID=UPI0009EB2586|nr:PTS sugar transporter subunit IIA [Lacticaseibacillus thailandensis]
MRQQKKNKRIRKYERVAVICTTGGGVSNLIRTQIIGIFPEANVRAFSFWQENDIEAFGPDLIFSVIPLKHSLKVPILYIKELLTRSDIENIKQVLFLNESSQIAPEKISTDQNYLTLFKANLFTTQQPLDYSTIIQSMSKQIVEQGYGDSDFVTNVLKREKYMSTVYNNGIAMPHPIEMKGVSSAVGVRIVKPSISEKGKDVKLVFMVCLARDDFRYYSRISDCIFNLMQNEQKNYRDIQQSDFSKFNKYLKGNG